MPKLIEIMENQKGWQLKECIIMEVRCDSMGYFPLVSKERNKKDKRRLVVTTSREDMKKLWEKLPKKHVRVDTDKFMVNEELKLAVPVNGSMGNESNTDSWLLVLDAEKQDPNELEYADEGLFSFLDESSAVWPACI